MNSLFSDFFREFWRGILGGVRDYLGVYVWGDKHRLFGSDLASGTRKISAPRVHFRHESKILESCAGGDGGRHRASGSSERT